MKITNECCVVGAVATALLFIPALGFAKDGKSYKHASEYQLAILDENLRVETGRDVTLGKNQTDAKLSGGGQGIHLLHTDAGDYRVEAPVNKGMTFLSAAGSNAYNPPKTFHNKWFLDNVQQGTKVLFASECVRPNKKHPTAPVRCSFYFPDPDSSDHEYATLGDFTPLASGDGSNTQKTADTLCGTGKLKPEVEAELCGGTPTPKSEEEPPLKTPEPKESSISNSTQSDSGKRENGIASLGLTVTNSENGGARIVKIASASPAEIGGLHVGDVLWTVDGKRIGSVSELEATLGDRSSGSTVRVQYLFHTNMGWMPGPEKVLILKAEGN